MYPNPSDKTRRWWRIGLLGIAFLFIGWVFLRAQHGLTPFIVGLTLAFVLMPLVDTLNRLMPRALAILLVYIMIIGALAGFFIYLVPIIVDQSNKLIHDTPRYIDEVQKWLNQTYIEIAKQIPSDYRQPLTDFVNDFSKNAINFVRDIVTGLIGGTFSLVFGTIGFVVGVLIVPFWLFFVLKDKSKGMQTLFNIVAPNLRDDARRVINIISFDLNDYIRGQLILAGSVAILCSIGLLIVGFDTSTSIFLGFIAGMFEVLPILGPILGAIPAIVVSFFYGTTGNVDLVIKVVILYIIVQQIEGNILVPKIAGDSTKLHPAVVMLVIIIGSEIGGLPGAIASVPFTALIRDVFVYLYQRTVLGVSPEEAEIKTPGRRDALLAERQRRARRQLKRTEKNIAQ
ncbi:AI-2E family transporter [Candidatus Chlorohelix sp.]|uniref:AI-2E family transporter n=1 Tax=Candidatus Chlorohelix sp. TaxID=3139201 RepID=UPI00302F44C9